MSGFWIFMVGLIVVDAIVLSFVLRRKLARMGGAGKISAFTAVHQRIADYMRVNYSGRPEQLPEVLRGLIPVVEEFAREKELTLDHDTIDVILITSVTAHRLAPRADVERALCQLREEKRAAA